MSRGASETLSGLGGSQAACPVRVSLVFAIKVDLHVHMQDF